MTRNTGYRFLDPAALARIKNLSLAARGVVEGFIAGMHASPNRGVSVEFAEHRNSVRSERLGALGTTLRTVKPCSLAPRSILQRSSAVGEGSATVTVLVSTGAVALAPLTVVGMS